MMMMMMIMIEMSKCSQQRAVVVPVQRILILRWHIFLDKTMKIVGYHYLGVLWRSYQFSYINGSNNFIVTSMLQKKVNGTTATTNVS
jgi:hypothetical protein